MCSYRLSLFLSDQSTFGGLRKPRLGEEDSHNVWLFYFLDSLKILKMLRKSRKYHDYRRYSSNGDLPWQKVTTHPKQMENFIDEQNITKHQTVSRLILWLMEEFLHQLGRLKHKQLLKDINWFAGFLPNNQNLSIFRINDPGISGRLWSQNQLPPHVNFWVKKSHPKTWRFSSPKILPKESELRGAHKLT